MKIEVNVDVSKEIKEAVKSKTTKTIDIVLPFTKNVSQLTYCIYVPTHNKILYGIRPMPEYLDMELSEWDWYDDENYLKVFDVKDPIEDTIKEINAFLSELSLNHLKKENVDQELLISYSELRRLVDLTLTTTTRSTTLLEDKGCALRLRVEKRNNGSEKVLEVYGIYGLVKAYSIGDQTTINPEVVQSVSTALLNYKREVVKSKQIERIRETIKEKTE